MILCKVNEMRTRKVLKPVKIPEKPIPDTRVNFLCRLKYQFNKRKEEQKKAMWNTIKNHLTGLIFRWIAKVGGGILLTIGISQNSWEEIITAVLSIIAGVATSLIQHKKIALTEPSKFEG